RRCSESFVTSAFLSPLDAADRASLAAADTSIATEPFEQISLRPLRDGICGLVQQWVDCTSQMGSMWTGAGIEQRYEVAPVVSANEDRCCPRQGPGVPVIALVVANSPARPAQAVITNLGLAVL